MLLPESTSVPSPFLVRVPEATEATAALADGRDLYAFRYSANDSSNSLYYRSLGNAVVVASEPLDQDRGSWIGVPDNSALIARWGEPLEIQPFLQVSGKIESIPAAR